MEKNNKLIVVGIKIKNYRSFKEFPRKGFLSINNFITIIGKNDIGKSNLLKALKVILDNENITIGDFHKHNIRDPCEITIKFYVPDSLKEEIKTYLDVEGYVKFTKQFIFEGEKVRSKYFVNDIEIKQKKFKEFQSFMPKPIFISAMENPEDEIKFQKGTVISELLLPILEEDSKEESVKRLIENLTNIINKKSKEITTELLKLGKLFLGDIEDINIKVEDFKLQKAYTPRVKIKDKYLKDEIDLMDRGNGFQRYFILSLLDVYRKRKIGKGFILLFEEPEIYLHFGAQKKLVNILKDFSKEGQVIITTHSPIFIDKTSIKNTYLFYKINGETRVKYIEDNIRIILEELGFTQSDILLPDYLIFIEGPSDFKIYKYLLDELDEFKEYNVSILPMGGGNNIKHFDCEFIKNIKKINPNIAIILDGDKYKKYKTKKKDFEDDGIILTFTKKNNKIVKSVENLFSVEAVKNFIKDIIKEYNQNIAFKEIEIDRIGYDKNVPSFIESIVRRKIKNPEWKYNKIKHGKRIISWMINNNDPNVEYFNQLFRGIFNFFKD